MKAHGVAVGVLALCTVAGQVGWAGESSSSTPATSAASTPAASTPEAIAPTVPPAKPSVRMGYLIDTISLEGSRAKDAVTWWSKTTGIPVVVDWDSMANESVNADAPVTLSLKQIPAWKVLRLILAQASPETRTIIQTTPWYVHIMTKTQADKHKVVRIYDVQDLLMEIPNFESSANMNLATSINNSGTSNGIRRGSAGSTGSSSSAQSSSSSSGSSLFSGASSSSATGTTKTARGEDLAKLVKDTIEPDVWVDAGGTATIKYFQGRLVVSAPQYVQDQIGDPIVAPEDRTDH